MTEHNDQERALFEAAYKAAVENGWANVKDMARQVWDQARAQLQTASVAVPDGWKLVPVEPTDEMVRAGINTPCVDSGNDADDQPQDYRNVYSAMLAAAPHPVSGEQKPVSPTIRDFADCVKQLCKDFSDLRDRPYMGDVTAAIDGLYNEFMSSDVMMAATECPAGDHPAKEIDDSQFVDEFMKWWEDHGQYVRSGGGDYERTFAFEAWRHLMPEVAAHRAQAQGGDE